MKLKVKRHGNKSDILLHKVNFCDMGHISDCLTYFIQNTFFCVNFNNKQKLDENKQVSVPVLFCCRMYIKLFL